MRIKLTIMLDKNEINEADRLIDNIGSKIGETPCPEFLAQLYAGQIDFDRSLTFSLTALPAYRKFLELCYDMANDIVNKFGLMRAVMALLEEPGAIVEVDNLKPVKTNSDANAVYGRSDSEELISSLQETVFGKDQRKIA